MAELPLHTPVFIWGRPEHNLILIFGEGTYEGFNSHLYPPCPVVRLSNGQEISIHYTGVNIGERGAVKAQCDKFKGDIIQWDLERFLRRELPSPEQRSIAPANVDMHGAPIAPPKTVTDRMLYLKREIQVEQLKIKARETEIETSKKIIETKRAEMATMKKAVLEELSSLDDVPEDAILAAAERIKAAREQPIAETTVPPSSIELSQDEFHRLATED